MFLLYSSTHGESLSPCSQSSKAWSSVSNSEFLQWNSKSALPLLVCLQTAKIISFPVMHCRLYYTLKNSWIDGFLTKHRLYTYLLHQKKFFFDVLTKKTILKIIQWCVLYCPTYLFNSNYLIMSHLKVLLHVSRSWSGSGYSGKHWERGLWAGIHTGHGVNSLNSLKIRSIVFVSSYAVLQNLPKRRSIKKLYTFVFIKSNNPSF